ncbi:MAG: shikimate dehydrogenase [Microscillaceae bacterium]|nr:shikimate dehydrogenase [Microscillaceae bacterium]
MRIYGLLGYPVSHSFSQKYFTQKFEQESIQDARYELFEMENLQNFPDFIKNNPAIQGLNVTIPHKQTIIPYLDGLADSARQVGAVNVIKIDTQGKLIGHNSDYYGFLQSLSRALNDKKNLHSMEGYKALILGTGGAAKAVEASLNALKIPFLRVSRQKNTSDTILYSEVNESVIQSYHLIINTTPLGMYPQVDSCPDLPYHFLSGRHLLYDLVYNPEETLFLKKGIKHGAKVKGGLEMLYLQAEKAWEIWEI